MCFLGMWLGPAPCTQAHFYHFYTAKESSQGSVHLNCCQFGKMILIPLSQVLQKNARNSIFLVACLYIPYEIPGFDCMLAKDLHIFNPNKTHVFFPISPWFSHFFHVFWDAGAAQLRGPRPRRPPVEPQCAQWGATGHARAAGGGERIRYVGWDVGKTEAG